MGEPRGSTNSRWNWEVAGFEPRKSVEQREDYRKPTVAPPSTGRRYSMSISSHSELSKHAVNSKLLRLKDKVKLVREDFLQLRQEAIDLQDYSSAKLDRVTRYLGALANKTRKLDQAALEAEARISPLLSEKKKLFNDLLTAKGNVKVFCRARPLFEDEGPYVVEFPDDYTVRLNTGDDSLSNPKKDFEFDRVYGPHIGQANLFADIQPFVQSAFDGYNVSVFAFGQTCSGKTHTMEGSSHDRGLYARSFEELFDLSNSDATSVCRYSFSVSVFELYNEQITDLLLESGNAVSKVCIGSFDYTVELVQEKVENPIEFSKVLKAAFQNRGTDALKFKVSHLIVMIHIYYKNLITGENIYSKLSLVDLAGSESKSVEEETGERATVLLHVLKSLSAWIDFASWFVLYSFYWNLTVQQTVCSLLPMLILLHFVSLYLKWSYMLVKTSEDHRLGDVLASVTSEKDDIPYENSALTKVLADSLGGSSKTLVVVNICPNMASMSETLSSLNFSARARNAMLSLGNRDTIKKWKDVANDARKELLEKEKEISDLKLESMGLKQDLRHANDQCVLLFNEVQKAWKVSFTLQSDLKAENIMLADKHKIEKEQNMQLRNQIAQLLQSEQEQKLLIEQRDSAIQMLQAKLKSVESQLNEALSSQPRSSNSPGSQAGELSSNKAGSDDMDSAAVTRRLEDELKKRDALIETELVNFFLLLLSSFWQRNDSMNPKVRPGDVSSPLASVKAENSVALVKSGTDIVKTTPAGEYLTSALNDFDPDQYDSLAAISDGANKLLMLVLAAVIKAGASREHEILAEIRDAVFAFIRKMEPKRVMDTMLVSRVRILYIRSLLARSPELQSIKVSPIDRFLEKPNSGRSRSSSRGSSPGKSPVRYDSTRNMLVEEQIQGFKVNIKPEKKSKLSSVVLKIRGIDQDTWSKLITGGKLREITEDAKSFAIGNKALAAIFVHTPAGELQRQIRNWLADNFDFLSVADDTVAGSTGQLELLSTAIMDGWMAGLGAAQPPNTDALGQLLSEYGRRVYTSQLQHLKDIAGTLAAEVAEDSAQVAKLRSALESVDHKRRKILHQMKNDMAMLSLEDGATPIKNPSTAAEDSRLASLISLDGILKQTKDVMRQTSANVLSKSKKRQMLASLDELSGQMPSLLDVDHPCAQRHIAEARQAVESTPEEDDKLVDPSNIARLASSSSETDVVQWNVLQFNTGSTTPFIIKCGANSSSELVIKADARVQEPKGGEIVRVVPKPTVLENMSLEEIKEVFKNLPEALSLLALARTADGTRARYSRLYRTLAMKVPALRDLVGELEKGGVLKDVKS
ncbi:kinesin like protein for actin based chloroplast movement 2 [Striga asiatica]|uniref:Kinesin like protein for actin based chloroplast movement 2 n=1 Tax=Striga asiatica TaxID=4170 RepID=A0A5A7QP57_STRAF|nr:kinesin like protein for actin based chloroplast movement 2 [Striga asiatica]